MEEDFTQSTVSSVCHKRAKGDGITSLSKQCITPTLRCSAYIFVFPHGIIPARAVFCPYATCILDSDASATLLRGAAEEEAEMEVMTSS